MFLLIGVDADALITDAGKGKGTLPNRATFNLLTKGVGWVEIFHINDASTVAADEMDVWVCVKIEMLITTVNPHRIDQPFLLEHGQVPVNRTQGEIGDLGLELGVDPFGGRMGCRTSHAFQNGIALFAVLSGRHHYHLLNNNDYYFCY